MATSSSLSSTSLSGLGLSGLSSGLDTSGIITKLMAIEAAPQNALKTKLSTATTHRTALQALNTSVAAIAAAAKSSAKAGALSSFTASSDTTGVTATAAPTAAAGSVSFTVTQLAKSQTSVTAAMSTWPDTSSATPSITLQLGTGTANPTTKTVTAATGSLDDVVAAINGSGTGISAAKIAAGTDSNGTALYRLQLRSNSGAANAFAVYQGSDTTGAQLPTTQVSPAQDATLTLYAGTAAEQQVSSSSNTFSSLITGVDVTVSATTSSPATVSIAADTTAATTSAQALTASLITLFSGIASATAISTTTSSTGASASTSGSVFTGDSSVRNLKDTLLSAASDSVNGRSLQSIGITLTKDGTITFDQGAFQAAMTKDPAGTTSMFQTMAGRVATASTGASDPYTGILTKQITSEQSTESSLNDEISTWDTRLAAIQAQYTAQFNNLETALNSLSSQASYITSQIAGLTTNYQNAT